MNKEAEQAIYFGLADLHNAAEYRLKDEGLSPGDIGHKKASITSAWNRIMSHVYGVLDHSSCGCELEPVKQDGSTSKLVELGRFVNAVSFLCDQGILGATKQEKLSEATEVLIEVLPGIANEFAEA